MKKFPINQYADIVKEIRERILSAEMLSDELITIWKYPKKD